MWTADQIFDRKMQALIQLLNRTRYARRAGWAVVSYIEQIDQKTFRQAMQLTDRFETAESPAQRRAFRERHREEVLAISFNAWDEPA
jgi:hypothetical protein